jgi:hypothetical protein
MTVKLKLISMNFKFKQNTYNLTSENQTPVGLAKMFRFWKFPEFRSSELSEQLETLHINCFSKTC